MIWSGNFWQWRSRYAALCAMHPERDPRSFTAREVVNGRP